MVVSTKWSLLLTICTAFAAATARADAACGGVAVPDRLQLGDKQLVRNGVGVRRATVLNVHVYVGALYLEQRTTETKAALESRRSKLLELHFVRDVSRTEMLEAIQEGVDKNAGAQLTAAKEHMRSFERYLPDLHKGTVLRLAYTPGRGLEVRANGKLLGTEPNDAFANLVFRIWLGEHPPDEKLKAQLLGASCD